MACSFILPPHSKAIPLAHHKYIRCNIWAIVDEDDYEWVSKQKWGYLKGYAKQHLPLKGGKVLSRLIMNAPENMQVDHINGDTLDNRKCNLRICTSAENNRNRKKQDNTSSIYKGVCWHKHRNKWIANISKDNKNYFLGRYNSETEAALAYNDAAQMYFGEFAWLNKIQCN